MHRLMVVLAVLTGAATWAGASPDVALPLKPDSLKLAVIGDNGTGKSPQYEVGEQMAAARARFPFELVLMLGDNLYGRQRPEDFVDKFERPYAALLRAGIPFHAALGNHDEPANNSYPPFNMGGSRYYTFVRKGVRFVVLDTNLLDDPQVAWAEDQLQRAPEPWKIVYFHHPLYSNGRRHGSNVELRVILEPLLVRHGVTAVFSGHEHFYERLTLQKGIAYFIQGSSGQLRKGNVRPSATTAAAFDQDRTFMLVEIAGDEMVFQTIARTGRVVDSGVVHRRPTT